jgi:hypothetical protein
MKRGVNMNHISGKIEQLLRLQEALRDRYEKENKVLLKTIEAQKEQISLLEQIVENQDKIIKKLEK